MFSILPSSAWRLKHPMSQKKQNRVIIVGDGTDVFYPYAENIIGVETSDKTRRYQNAVGVALAAEQLFKDGAAVTPESLLPVYLRLPQAQRELKKRQEGAKRSHWALIMAVMPLKKR